MWRKMEILYLDTETEKLINNNHCGKQHGFKLRLPYENAVPLHGAYPEKMKSAY